MNARIVSVICVAIALIGVLGEALLLRHELVDSYPFKLMTFPPWQFYRSLGIWGAGGLVVVIAIVAVFWRATSPLTLPPLLTGTAPLLLLAAVVAATGVQYGFKVPAGTRNFDGYTVVQATFELGKTSLWLSLAGLAIGSVCSLLLRPLVIKATPSTRGN